MEENNGADPCTTELEELQKKCDEYLNGWKRAKADFINYQKDEQKRFHDFIQFANEALIQNLIVVLDSFNLAVNALKNPDQGLLIIKSQLEDTLKKHGLEPILAKAGDQFLPEMHEAIAMTENNADSSPNASHTIAEIIEIGYTLNGKVIRPARVKITQ